MKGVMLFLAMLVLLAGCAVKVEYLITEQMPGKEAVTTHKITYERPIFVGQEIGEFKMSRDEKGHPVISFSGQKSEATQLVAQAAEIARTGVELAERGLK